MIILLYCCFFDIISPTLLGLYIIQQSTFHRVEVIIDLSKYWLKLLRESHNYILKYMCNLEKLNELPLYIKK